MEKCSEKAETGKDSLKGTALNGFPTAWGDIKRARSKNGITGNGVSNRERRMKKVLGAQCKH